MGLAIGYLNMSLEEFWDFTPRQLQIKLDARREYEDLLQRFEWERVRFQTTALINKDRKRKDQIKQTDLISFDWDKTNAIKDRQQERKKAMYLMEKEKRKLKNV
jgi:hypothetical protein|tara:strand:- start:43 stop:354 length:312 start_codon:yes stop_codon:yes gene_type:complete